MSDRRGTDDPAGYAGGVGMRIPGEHVGAFIAEVFEDPERRTTWDDAVAALVAPDARDDWAALSAREQVVELLSAAGGFDERALETLSALPEEADAETVRDDFEEALRLRRVADTLRCGVADAYASDHVDDAALRAAVDDYGFETDVIARRERELERVAGAHGFDFRPYGGTLLDPPDDETATDSACDW